MNIMHYSRCLCLLAIALSGSVFAVPPANKEAKLYRFSTTVEKERPQLNEATRKLIEAYRKDPSEENRAALRKQVEANYDAVVARKKAKLEELKKEAKHESKIKEMEEIVDDIIKERENRIEQSMRRFTDSRLRPGVRDARDGFLPIIGAASNTFIAYTPVTNKDYAKFLAATGRKAPAGWQDNKIPAGKENHPVVNVSYTDAIAYCVWRTAEDNRALYRLPNEAEWEQAAGHMPKDAPFNCGEASGTTPVDAYAKTLAACGAIDMWGNCWEWTSTSPADGMMEVKGGAWDARRMECRTEHRGVYRKSTEKFNNVTFRIVRETTDEKIEPRVDSPRKPRSRK